MNEIEQVGEHLGLFVVGIAGSAGCVYTIATGDADFILPPAGIGHEVSLVRWTIQ